MYRKPYGKSAVSPGLDSYRLYTIYGENSWPRILPFLHEPRPYSRSRFPTPQKTSSELPTCAPRGVTRRKIRRSSTTQCMEPLHLRRTPNRNHANLGTGCLGAARTPNFDEPGHDRVFVQKRSIVSAPASAGQSATAAATESLLGPMGSRPAIATRPPKSPKLGKS